MSRAFAKVPGGLGISVVIVGALLAASTGIVGATVVTMGLMSLPVMNRAGYDKKLSTGLICASGTLGQIIPPSIVLILLGDVSDSSALTFNTYRIRVYLDRRCYAYRVCSRWSHRRDPFGASCWWSEF